jgi:hypothetical protein
MIITREFSEDLYKKVCDALKTYEDKLPDHPETGKIRKQKENLERKYPYLKMPKNGEKVE